MPEEVALARRRVVWDDESTLMRGIDDWKYGSYKMTDMEQGRRLQVETTSCRAGSSWEPGQRSCYDTRDLSGMEFLDRDTIQIVADIERVL